MKTLLAALLLGMAGAFMQGAALESTAAAPTGHGSYTDVVIEGNVVTIVVPISVIYALSSEDGPPDPEGVSFVEAGFAAGAAYWNAGFARFAECYELRLQIDAVLETEDSADAERRHVVHPYEQSRAGKFADGRGLPTVGYPQLPPTAGDLDVTYPFDSFSVGYLPTWLFEDSWAMAHELGHFFGLGDDYRDGEVIPGREGTLMGGTEGADYIDKSLVDDVTKLIEEAGYELPQCITGSWTYGYDSNFATAEQAARTKLDMRVEFRMTPRPDGTVSGTGQAHFAFESTATNLVDGCTATYPRIESDWTVKIAGTVTDGALSFQVSPPFETVQAQWSGCGQSGTEGIDSPVFYGWNEARFRDGVFEHREEFGLGSFDSGSGRLELKLKQSNAD